MIGFTSHFHSLFLLLVFRSGLALNVSIPLFAPSNTPTLSPSLVSFSIEQDRWVEWVGAPSRNDFFFNTLENLKRLSGEPPRIRIGANSEDRTIYDSSVQFSEARFPAPSAKTSFPEATNISVGDAFYATAQLLPSNTRITWGLNLGQKNLTATFLEARALLKAFSLPNITDAAIVLEAIEIGNEADLYANNGMRARGYDEVTYVKEWVAFADNVSMAMNLTSKTLPRFWGAGFAGSSVKTTGFSPQAIIDQGVLNTYPGSLITTISQHRYSGSFCSGSSGLLQDLMSKVSIRGNLTVFGDDIKAVRNKGLDYVLGETNSYACHGAPGVSNTAGAALWMLDYLLFASQIGISRLYFHQGIGFKYNLVQPTTLLRSTIDGTALATPMAPHIQPPYYAAIIAAEVLGHVKINNTEAGARALELAVDNPRVAAYAFYGPVEGKVSSLLLINSQAHFRNTTSKGKVHIDLSFSSVNSTNGIIPPRNMTIKRLAIPFADDTAGITWGGQTYETTNGQVSGELKVETVAVERGFDLWDTEAVLAYFD